MLLLEYVAGGVCCWWRKLLLKYVVAGVCCCWSSLMLVLEGLSCGWTVDIVTILRIHRKVQLRSSFLLEMSEQLELNCGTFVCIVQ